MKTKTNLKWVIKVVAVSAVASMVFTFASTEILGRAGYAVAFALLLVFISVGILFDVIGVAATVAQEAPFHSMAAHREQGAAESLRLVKNADKVSSICSDIVSDVSGIICGSMAALIASRLTTDIDVETILISLAISAAVTGLIIGGKAVGKTFAMNNSTGIVLRVGKLINLGARLTSKK